MGGDWKTVRSRALGVFVSLGVLVLSVLAGTASAQTTDEGHRVLEVRFKASAAIRGDDSSLGARRDETLESVTALLERSGAISFEPLVSGISQTAASEIAADAARTSETRSPNMADWYRMVVPEEASARALALLRDSPLVDYAAKAPDSLPPPSTPDFSSLQSHLDPAPEGIGAQASLADPRTRGAGVTIVDLEYYWTREHEDLLLPESADIGTPAFVQYPDFDDEHGTAVLGILGAKDNGFGVTGIVPDATLKGISPVASGGGYNPAGALTFLTSKLQAGDVVLIEQQADGPGPGTSDYVPLEWNQASFDAIRQLTNLGIVVVETGANGGYDLDSPQMLGRFDRNVRDSGAILVGAGDSSSRSPLWYSSHGSRMDLQGHGNYIATTGGAGTLQGAGPGERSIRYTDNFGGTSGAGPIVAGAVAAVLSYLKAKGLAPMSSADIAELLRSTGSPQSDPGSGLIGPLPDVSAAISRLDSQQPRVTIHSPVADGVIPFNSARALDLSCDAGNGPPLESCLAVDRGPQGERNLVEGDLLPTGQPGLHTITATATNELGLSASETVTYTVGPGCVVPGLTINSAVPSGQKVRILGLADPALAGKKVNVQRAGRKVAVTKIRNDGQISVTVKKTSRSAGKKAEYRLVMGRKKSAQIKPNGSLKIISRRPLADADEIKLKLKGVKKKGNLVVRTMPACGGRATTRTVKHDRRGLFKIRLGFSPAAQTFSIRKGKRQAPVPLVLPAERFVLGD